MALESLVADPKAFELSVDKLEGDFTLLSLFDHAESFEIGTSPLLLLPVRIETRFFGDDLKIRVYPDQLQLDDHAPLLTEREVALGVAYWERRLDGEPDAARDDLVRELPPRRAVWVARETRPTVAKSGERVYPDLNTRRNTPPATAALMPDRWCAIGFVGNTRAFVAWGREIPTPLHCSPDLADLVAFEGGDEALPVDDAMAWMVDYERAMGVGMAITVDVSDVAIGDDGLTLFVAGVRGELNNEAALLTLLEAHHYSDGLDVMAQGTATNNTDEAIAGWSAAVDDVAALFERELDDDGLAGASRSAAAGLATALGLGDNTVLRRLPGAVPDEDAAMAAMNRVLWPVTWGRYITDLLAPEEGPSLLAPDKHLAVREFFCEHVRGGAPLPTLVVGPHPYGLLPMMRRDSGDMHSPEPLFALEGVLLELRERWRESLPGVQRLDPVDRAADEVAVEVLGLMPHPKRFVVRRLNFLWDIRTGFWEEMWKATEGTDVRALAGLYESGPFIIGVGDATSIAQELEVLNFYLENKDVLGPPGELRKRMLDFIRIAIDLCEAHRDRQTPFNEWYPDAISGVFNETVTTDPKIFFSGYSAPEVDELFTRGLVLTSGSDPSQYLSDLRFRVAGPGARRPSPRAAAGPPAPPFARRSSATRSLARHRARIFEDGPPIDPEEHDIPGIDLGKPLLRQLIEAVVDDVSESEAASYSSALATLSGRSVDELELRLRETLGLASHRLDAWITGLASSALADLRDEGGGALRVGGFGWVEKLTPRGTGTRESHGFIHAPSLEHAATAAVLRSGWDAHGSHDPGSSMAVDLRSERVRAAAYLLDGVRRGGELGDLLGCRFERRLHDLLLDRFIDDCRRRVLEAKGITRAPRGPVDGLELAELYHGPGVRIDLPDEVAFTVRPDKVETAPGRVGLQGALNGLLASMDAVADASLADSMHYLLQGNSDRASATLDAVATGAVPPPRLSGLDTPVTGASVTHRLIVALPPAASPVQKWGSSARSELEPSLSAWVASLLGDPAKVRCAVRVGATGERVPVSLADIAESQGFSPLDALFESPGIWERRARAHFLSQPVHARLEDDLLVDTAPADLPPGELSFDDLSELASALRSLLAASRPLDARDLALPGAELESGADQAEAGARVAGFRAGLTGARKSLERLLPRPSEAVPAPVGKTSLASIRAALLELAGHGIANAVPVHGYAEAGREALHADAWAALATAKARLDADSPLEPGFPLLPLFSADGSDFESALRKSGELLADDPAAAMGWLRSVAHVRADAGALEDAITLTELLYDEARIRPVVGQLPRVQGEPWVALHAPGDRRRGALSWFVVDAGGRASLSESGTAAGLVIDEWAEVIPSGDVVTGVALNVDAPSSRPPQAMLLGLPPRDRSWSFDNVIDTLLEALEAAKLRAVDPDVLVAYGHQMPAIFPPVAIDSGPQEASDG